MTRMVHCIKLDKEAEGLDFPPYPGELGDRLYDSVCKEAWEAWKRIQTMMVNEYRLPGNTSGNRWKTIFSGMATLRRLKGGPLKNRKVALGQH